MSLSRCAYEKTAKSPMGYFSWKLGQYSGVILLPKEIGDQLGFLFFVTQFRTFLCSLVSVIAGGASQRQFASSKF